MWNLKLMAIQHGTLNINVCSNSFTLLMFLIPRCLSKNQKVEESDGGFLFLILFPIWWSWVETGQEAVYHAVVLQQVLKSNLKFLQYKGIVSCLISLCFKFSLQISQVVFSILQWHQSDENLDCFILKIL